jgi:hypothetical protein
MLRAYLAGSWLLLLSATACTSFGQGSDCHDICDRFRDCVSVSYSVERCQQRCDDADSQWRARAIRECSICIDQDSCYETGYNCGNECAWIIPYE